MEWSALCEEFSRCVVTAENAADNVGRASTDDGDDDGDAVAALSAELDNALTSLNRKLIELHSRLKALDEETLELMSSSSLTDASPSSNKFSPESPAAASSRAASYLSREVASELVDGCKRVLSHPRRKRKASGEKRTGDDGHRGLGSASNHHALAAQLLAELGKSEMGRGVCLEKEVTFDLEGALSEQVEAAEAVEEGDCALGGEMETTVQILRILGNLCYDCPDGRAQLLRSKCLEHVLAVARSREGERAKSGDPGQRFPVILPGFLLNFCNDNKEATERCGELGFVGVVASNVLSTQTNDAVFNATLNLLVAVAEAPESAGRRFLSDCPEFPLALNHVIVHTTSPEVTETALELLKAVVAEDEDLSLKMVSGTQICDTLVNHIVGRWRGREFEEHRSNACDVLVLMLSHDSSMKHVYSAQNGALLQTFMGWLRKDDLQLKVTASLAIGNFACSDEHTEQLVDEVDAAENLVGLLRSQVQGNHHPSPGELKLQHAVLGALRNLAVNPVARRQLVAMGLLDPCLQLSQRLPAVVGAQPVVFKLLQAVRLTVDGSGESANVVGGDAAFMAKAVEWGAGGAMVEGVIGVGGGGSQGVKSEAARLIAAVVKNGKSKEVMESIVSLGGVPHLTTMLMSSHVRMLNEALIALTVMAAVLDESSVHAQLHTDLVINGVKRCVGNADHPVEVRANACTFASRLLESKTEDFRKMLDDMEFGDALDAAVVADSAIADRDEFRGLRDKLDR